MKTIRTAMHFLSHNTYLDSCVLRYADISVHCITPTTGRCYAPHFSLDTCIFVQTLLGKSTFENAHI